MINISEAALHDNKGFESTILPKDTIIVEEKGYWDFEEIRGRVLAENNLVTKFRQDVVYKIVRELDLSDNEDQHILIDEIIHLTGERAKETEIDHIKFRRIVAI